MPSVCFLAGLAGTAAIARNDNRQRLPAAFAAAGWGVTVRDHQTVRLLRGEITLAPDDRPLASFDLIWLIGLGPRASFLDRMQLLATLEADRFVNSPLALLELHAKYRLAAGTLAAHHPETHASSDPGWLAAMIDAGGRWIAKPAAGSFGQDVYVLSREDANRHVILEHLTGHDGSCYCLLQRYVPEVENGEKRALVANGELVGCYLRRPGRDHRANLAGDARAEPASLEAAELHLVRAVATTLAARGVRFAAVDVAYPWVIEFNLANPGGLETLERLTGIDATPRVVEAFGRPFP